jgi:hypothetical protein
MSAIPFPTTKPCSKCHAALPLLAFPRASKGRYGRAAECKTCVRRRRDQREGRAPSSDRLLAAAREALGRVEAYLGALTDFDGCEAACRACPTCEAAEGVMMARGAALRGIEAAKGGQR